MALAILVTLERDIGDASAAYAKSGTGKALAREAEKLDYAARCCNVAQPSSLLSESQASLIDQLKADGFDPTRMRLPPERFFPAADGLKVVRALVEYVTKNLKDFKQPNPILRDLRAAEALLAEAEKVGVKFHFTKAQV
jgi:hypothetical protein